MRWFPVALVFATLLAAALPSALVAQQAGPAANGQQDDAPRVFLDCQGVPCDFNYIRTEVRFVDYVRDRAVADVHLLITGQRTGSGGRAYTLNFYGQQRFAGVDQVLRYAAPPNATSDEVRTGLTQLLELGLVPYASRTGLAGRLQVSYKEPPPGEATTAVMHDPWNFWTFRARVRGEFDGEARQRQRSVSGSFSASRITEAWKVDLSLDGYDYQGNFEVNDSTTVTAERNSYGTRGLVVRSLGSHWSAGARGYAGADSRRNQDLSVSLSPAIEYSVFPYEDVTRRQFTLLYSVGLAAFDYTEETIFGETAETRPRHGLDGAIRYRQPWGSASVVLEGDQYLDDLSKYSADLYGNLDIRLFRGFSLDLSANASYVQDQLYLPVGNATPEEVLLRVRQLETTYEYGFSVGIAYTFGSIFNTVVNPRF